MSSLTERNSQDSFNLELSPRNCNCSALSPRNAQNSSEIAQVRSIFRVTGLFFAFFFRFGGHPC